MATSGGTDMPRSYSQSHDEADEYFEEMPLEIMEELCDRVVKLGASVKLSCRINTVTEAMWYKDGAPLKSTQSTPCGYHLLTLDNVSLEDEGEYRCQVDHLYTDAYLLLVEDPDFKDMYTDSEAEDTDGADKKRKRGRPVGSIKQIDTDEEEEHVEKTTRKKRLLDVKLVAATLCCSLLCLGQLLQGEIESAREVFQALTNIEKQQWLLDYMWSHSRFSDVDGKWEFLFVIGTTTVCSLAFQLTLGIPRSTFYAIRQKFLGGEKVIPSKGSRFGRKSVNSMAVLSWLQHFANQFAEKLPDSTQLHLPCCSTKSDVFETMKKDLEQDHLMVSFSHFMRLWRQEMHHIAIPKNSRFSKCNTCIYIKTQMAHTRNETERRILQGKRTSHLKKQNAERQKYYKHQTKAKAHPDKYMSIIIDGMDQSKTYIPHFVYASKFTSNMWKLKLHLVGLIIHGIGVYGFFDLFQWSHSSNMTITVLLEVLLKLKNRLSDTLYLQMDNCYRENKNRFMLAFLAMLVEKKIFRKIKVSFLMVGHTHEDIDQVFSRFSHWLNRHPVMTLPKIMTGFEKCYHPTPTSEKIKRIFNVSEWVSPHIEKIKGQSKPHTFKFVLGADGKAILFWKKWSTDKSWNQCSNPLLKSTPEGAPNLVPASYEDIDIDQLKTDVTNSFKYFNNEEDRVWWRNFWTSYNSESGDTEIWPMEELLRAKEAQRQNKDPEIVVDPFQFEDEDAPIPPVVIGTPAPVHTVRQLMQEDLVLTDHPGYPGEWPQVAKVVHVENGSTVHIQWFKGSKTTAWTPCTKPIPGQKGKRQPWVEKIPMTYIWFWGFKLTPSGHLPAKTKQKLDSYEK